MNRSILKIFLATLLVFLVLTPSFAFSDDNEGKAQIKDYDPQDPMVPEMVEPCGENGIPVIYLTIDPDDFEEVWQSGEHTYRAPGQIRITVPEGYTSEYGADLVPDTGDLDLEYIRGRGNSTWKGAKRPFRLKLDKKADLLGMGTNKHWVLLANAFDSTLLRNRIIGCIGKSMGLDYTPKAVPVDLIVNDTYRGSYTLCENVRIDNNRIDIDEIKPGNDSEPEITGGYLLEMYPGSGDKYSEFTTDRNVELGVHTPDFTEYKEAQYPGRDAQSRYISGYIQNLENAIYAEDFKDPDGDRYSDLMDIESAAKYWWVQEFTLNGDAFGTSSTYMYKERSGKLYWGPLWDFDLALSQTETETVFNNTEMPWLDHMRAYDPEHQKILREEWDRFDQILKDITKKGGILDTYAEEIRSSWKNDNVAYKKLYEEEDTSYETAEAEFNEQIEILRKFIDSRRIAIEKNIGDLYKVFGKVTFRDGKKILKTIEVRFGSVLDDPDYPELPDRKGFRFKGWYTDEGLTKAFDFRSAITEDTDLYAKWEKEEDKPGEDDGNKDDDTGDGASETQPPATDSDSPGGEAPATGDDTNLTPWIILMLCSALILVLIGFRRKRSR